MNLHTVHIYAVCCRLSEVGSLMSSALAALLPGDRDSAIDHFVLYFSIYCIFLSHDFRFCYVYGNKLG